MKNITLTIILFLFLSIVNAQTSSSAWIRINQLGYRPGSVKNAVWCSKLPGPIDDFQLIKIASNETVFKGKAGKAFGAYGPFKETYRLDFSAFTSPGQFKIKVGDVESPAFTIGEQVYDGTADFCLRYMRQQRTGFNPYLKDSCHTQDGYVLYASAAGIPDSTFHDVVGGWHDASDYLQYSTTSANATYHLLAAYRDFPLVFKDTKQASGLDGKNGKADILEPKANALLNFAAVDEVPFVLLRNFPRCCTSPFIK